jgi:hypothetical protein
MTFFEILTHKRPFSGLREGGDTMMNERCNPHPVCCFARFFGEITSAGSSFWEDVSLSGDHNGGFNGCGPMCDPLNFIFDLLLAPPHVLLLPFDPFSRHC